MDGPRLIAPILAVALGAGACAAHRPATPSVAMETALAQARDSGRVPLEERLGAGLRGPGTFGTGQPAVPVVVPPDIRRVWVPTHENQDGELVAGHWVFLRVRDFRWFLEPPPADGNRSAVIPLDTPATPPIPGRGAKPGSGVPWIEVPAATPGGTPRPAGASGATAPPPRSAGGASPASGR
jgi:hypothetical protein